MAADISAQFTGLPIEDLIVSPIVGMAKGQAKLNDVTWKYINEVAFVTDKDGNTTARSLDVQMQRVMTDPTDGSQSVKTLYSKVPMLPLVPLPALAITSADIAFTMEVKTSEVNKDSSDSSASFSASASGGFWGMKYSATMSGSVAAHHENTRSTDNSAKYDVKVHAEQLPPTEGMLKLSNYLTQMLEPSLIEPSKNANGPA